MNDRDFGCIRQFDIDHGELDAFRRNECFVLGYECAQVDAMLEKPESFHKVVHVANKERINAQVLRLNRQCEWRWPHDDSSEAWIYLDVAPTGAAHEA